MPQRFEVVNEAPEMGQQVNPQLQQQIAKARAEQQAAHAAVMLALKTLSQRATIALAGLRTLLMVGSAFWLWQHIPNPNPYQIASEAIYGGFILAVCYMTRPKVT